LPRSGRNPARAAGLLEETADATRAQLSMEDRLVAPAGRRQSTRRTARTTRVL
jgi:hypothetical protein